MRHRSGYHYLQEKQPWRETTGSTNRRYLEFACSIMTQLEARTRKTRRQVRLMIKGRCWLLKGPPTTATATAAAAAAAATAAAAAAAARRRRRRRRRRSPTPTPSHCVTLLHLPFHFRLNLAHLLSGDRPPSPPPGLVQTAQVRSRGNGGESWRRCNQLTKELRWNRGSLNRTYFLGDQHFDANLWSV